MNAIKLTENTGPHKAGKVIPVTDENLHWCHAMVVRGKAVPHERSEGSDSKSKRPATRSR